MIPEQAEWVSDRLDLRVGSTFDVLLGLLRGRLGSIWLELVGNYARNIAQLGLKRKD